MPFPVLIGSISAGFVVGLVIFAGGANFVAKQRQRSHAESLSIVARRESVPVTASLLSSIAIKL